MNRYSLSTQLDIFNVLNGNAVLGARSFNYGVAGYNVPSEVLQARLFKASATLTF